MGKRIESIRFIWAIGISAVTLATTHFAWAAPMPGALSKIAAPKLGVLRSPLGFEIANETPGWTVGDAPEGNRYVQAVFRGPSSADGKGQAVLTVRADPLERPMPLERYVQRWQKEYPKYGFDVIGSKTFAQGKMRGHVIDLLNKDGQKQLRQVVFLRGKTAAILTCRDQTATFKESLKGCNAIIKSFKWTE